MKVVIDTNVVVDHFRATDGDSSNALVVVKSGGHEVLVCQKLLWEYRNVLSSGAPQMRSLADVYLMQLFPRMRQCSEPRVRITFGPIEDRFHMQLAIDNKAGYHVSRDREVLAAASDMLAAGAVKACHPREFVADCGQRNKHSP